MMARLLVILILSLSFLPGCSVLDPPAKQAQKTIDGFRYALRWQRYEEAAHFFTKEHGKDFLEQMEPLVDLNVTDVRLRRFDMKDPKQQVAVRLEMDYFILPSTTLRTLRIDQDWQWFEPEHDEPGGYLITTPFPKLP